MLRTRCPLSVGNERAVSRNFRKIERNGERERERGGRRGDLEIAATLEWKRIPSLGSSLACIGSRT